LASAVVAVAVVVSVACQFETTLELHNKAIVRRGDRRVKHKYHIYSKQHSTILCYYVLRLFVFVRVCVCVCFYYPCPCPVIGGCTWFVDWFTISVIPCWEQHTAYRCLSCTHATTRGCCSTCADVDAYAGCAAGVAVAVARDNDDVDSRITVIRDTKT